MRAPAPDRAGLSPSVLALPAGRWPSLLDYLAQRFSHVSAAQWQQRLQAGLVLDASGQALAPDAAYTPHCRIFYYRQVDDEPEPTQPERVLYQDAHLLVADKPHFMSVTPGGRHVQHSLLVRLKRQFDLPDLQALHRLDRDTAGLVLFSTQRHERDAYHALFRQQRIHKTYHAIAPWRDTLQQPQTRSSHIGPDAQFFRQRELPAPPNAHTHIQMLQRQGPQALYRLSPSTGQTHQLRVHMAALGAPIQNDPYYPQVTRGPQDPDDLANPLQLLAQGLQFTDPITGEERCFQTTLGLMGLVID